MTPNNSYELKYTLPHHRCILLKNFLSRVLYPDPNYPYGVVATIYFDTQDLVTLNQKITSDYLKTKVRLRWYLNREGLPQSNNAFLEIKHKIGAQRKKIHQTSAFNPQWLNCCNLDDPRFSELAKEALALKEEIPFPLFPVLELRYERRRFIDPKTGARIAIDSSIRVNKVNRRLIAFLNPCELPLAVFEHKSAQQELPRHLLPVIGLGGRKESFSKYLACISHLMRNTDY